MCETGNTSSPEIVYPNRDRGHRWSFFLWTDTQLHLVLERGFLERGDERKQKKGKVRRIPPSEYFFSIRSSLGTGPKFLMCHHSKTTRQPWTVTLLRRLLIIHDKVTQIVLGEVIVVSDSFDVTRCRDVFIRRQDT